MRISFRFVGTFNDKVSGELPTNLGGVSSFGPPVGVPWRAHERNKIEMKNNIEKRIARKLLQVIQNLNLYNADFTSVLIKNQTANAIVNTLILTGFFE